MNLLLITDPKKNPVFANDGRLPADSRVLGRYDTRTETFAILVRELDWHTKVLLKNDTC